MDREMAGGLVAIPILFFIVQYTFLIQDVWKKAHLVQVLMGGDMFLL
jgi:hypothetical protein